MRAFGIIGAVFLTLHVSFATITKFNGVSFDTSKKINGATRAKFNGVTIQASGPSGSPAIASVSGGTPRSDFSGPVGMQFSVDTGATVTAVGRWRTSGNSQTHTVEIWKASDLSVLASVSVDESSGTVGAFKYVTLGTPLSLTAGTYYVMSTETSGGDQWLDDDATVTAGSHITINFSAYSAGGAAHASSKCYVPVSFLYTVP